MLCLLGGATGEQQLWLNSVDRKPPIGREYGAAFRKPGFASPWVNKIEPREPRRQLVDDARHHSPATYSQILVCPETFAQRVETLLPACFSAPCRYRANIVLFA
jgi:hypothetical protein